MALIIPAYYIAIAAVIFVVLYFALTSKLQGIMKLALVMYTFFLTVAVPLSYAVSSALGDIEASGVMFVLYIVLGVIIYAITYYKALYKE